MAPHLWTNNTIAALVTHKASKARIAVIGHYSSPGKRVELDAELLNVLQQIRYSTPQIKIVIAGDFNRKVQWMLKLAQQTNLQLC